MMLEEMKKHELYNGEGGAMMKFEEEFSAHKDLEDSLEFKAGEMTVEGKEELRVSYLAFEERLENLMH